MKKSINFISSIILAFTLNACSANTDDHECFDPEYFDFDESLAKWGISFKNVCSCVTDPVKYPKPWTIDIERTFFITDKTIRSMSTCGLLVTFQEYPGGGTMKSRDSAMNEVIVELFNRDDFYSVLVSKYLSVIKVSEYQGGGVVISSPDGPFHIERLLASDRCISALSEKEKIQLMAMALERTKYAKEIENMAPCQIMIAIMKSCEYAPFVKDYEQWLEAYNMLDDDGIINVNILIKHHKDIVEYAIQFINDNK